ncbi:predicted protein [Histoplasma capsulatum G186AR]|uniref:Uncharacterized protein n=1 Tax=Ajellomyces capsulatus (strain G186AR / H82 / ATCC MYA-2454 / RMSCC 2432) TaxID=447093 RepID=C0NPG9_AJECG|nr:uncharacterized protein HCBG_05049 [Histoplasma capsulatum G186AR]EEH06829.1 predicted protein [Histoplasma capsulatum G186AR]
MGFLRSRVSILNDNKNPSFMVPDSRPWPSEAQNPSGIPCTPSPKSESPLLATTLRKVEEVLSSCSCCTISPLLVKKSRTVSAIVCIGLKTFLSPCRGAGIKDPIEFDPSTSCGESPPNPPPKSAPI